MNIVTNLAPHLGNDSCGFTTIHKNGGTKEGAINY